MENVPRVPACSRRKSWPSDAATMRSASAALNQPSVSEHASSLAFGLTRGLAELEPGPLAKECAIRRSEVLEGIGQVLHVIDATDQAVYEARDIGISPTEGDCYANRLRWAVGMCSGLQRGVEALVIYDVDRVADEYHTIAALLGECGQRLSRLSRILGLPKPSKPSTVARPEVEAAATEDRIEDAFAREVQWTLWRLGELLQPAGYFLDCVTPVDATKLKVPVRSMADELSMGM